MKDSLKKAVFFIISTLKITYYNLSLLTSHFSLFTLMPKCHFVSNGIFFEKINKKLKLKIL